MQLKCQSRTQSPQALWPAVSQQEPLPKEPEDSGYEIAELLIQDILSIGQWKSQLVWGKPVGCVWVFSAPCPSFWITDDTPCSDIISHPDLPRSTFRHSRTDDWDRGTRLVRIFIPSFPVRRCLSRTWEQGWTKRSALDNIGWSGPDWSEFSDRPCDVIVRLLSRNKQIWRWSALSSFALCDKFAGGQLCWDNYSSVYTLKDWQSRFFRGVDECLHAFTILSLPTASLDVTSLYCCRGHYIT